MGHNVLRAYHQMAGYDWVHDMWVPGSPSPAGVAPYKVFFPVLTGATFLTAKYGTTVVDQVSWTMIRGTDIGPLIPHIGPPNLFWPPMLLLSGSKSHFGSAQVNVEGDGKIAAVAVAKIVNVNLNCCGPLKCVPLPLGFVITHNTVEADFTKGDFMGGLANMGVDMVLEFAINWLFFGIGKIPVFERIIQGAYEKGIYKGLDWALGKVFPSTVGGLWGKFGSWLFVKQNMSEALFRGLGHQFLLTVASVLGGSPVGIATPWSPGAGGLGVGDYMDSQHDAVRDYYNTPAAEDHPSAPPDAGADGAGAASTDEGGGVDAGTGGTEPDADTGGTAPDAATESGDEGGVSEPEPEPTPWSVDEDQGGVCEPEPTGEE